MRDRTLLVVMVSASDVITLIRYSANPWFRRELESVVQAGSIGIGVVAIVTEHQPRVERCFHFPWHEVTQLDDSLCRRIEDAMAATPADILRANSGIEIPPRASV
jgi:hypothetical protein